MLKAITFGFGFVFGSVAAFILAYMLFTIISYFAVGH